MADHLTKDQFLGGRIMARQPAAGFRSGLDAVMLAAGVPAKPGDDVLELGSGAGVASLCLASRAGCSVTGLEIDSGLAGLAGQNAAANEMGSGVRFVAGDVLAPPPEIKRDFAHVMTNPPFHGAAGQTSPDPGRAAATHDVGRLGEWLKAGFRRTASGGTFTTILRADRLGEALAALPETGVVVCPLWPRLGVAAKRVILQATKGARRPLELLPGLILHNADGAPSAAAEAILRHGEALALRTGRRTSQGG
jgi:tRNA1(Val) A37 N6-methylase TrmN6